MNIASNNNVAQAIYSAIKNKTRAEQSLIFKKAVQFLVKRKLLSKAPDILLRLSKIINDDEGVIVAKVSSAEKISEITKKELMRTISKRYSGKTVDIIENLDKKLLGGLKIKVNDEVMDLTIKNRIGKLQEYLTQSA